MYSAPEKIDPIDPSNFRYWVRPMGEQVDLCYRAACDGDLDALKEHVRQLLHNHEAASVEEQPYPGWIYESLSEAIRQNNIQMVQFLLDENVAGGVLPVEEAVRRRAFGVLELFLRSGCDVNQPRGRNEPPVLSIPLCTSDEAMVKWLVDHGADPNSRCDWDFTPTSYAMRAASLKTIDYLFQQGANPLCGQLLHHAVLRDEPDALEVVRLIVEKGAPINEIQYENDPKTYWELEPLGLRTPLHQAAELGKLDIVDYLLEMGADPLKLDSKGRTPRFWAENNGFMEVVRALEEANNLQRGPNTYIEREPFGLGSPPLHRAAELGQLAVVNYLLEWGADPMTLDAKGQTPRFVAEKKGFMEVVHALEEAENLQRERVNSDPVLCEEQAGN